MSESVTEIQTLIESRESRGRKRERVGVRDSVNMGYNRAQRLLEFGPGNTCQTGKWHQLHHDTPPHNHAKAYLIQRLHHMACYDV